MKSDNIKQLLNKFYSGETSLKEEKILSDFFHCDTVPDEFLPDKNLFFALSKNHIDVPREESEKIERLIDSFKPELNKKAKKAPLIYWTIGVVASLAILFGITQFYTGQQTKDALFTDTYDNPDDAYRATMDALQLFSQNFSQGTETMEKAGEHLEKTQEIINQSIK